MPHKTKTRIRLEGYLDVPSERLAVVIDSLAEHVALSRAEVGCIEFNVTLDPDVPGRLHVSELFNDEAAFMHHQVRTRASSWADITLGIERNYSFTRISSDESAS